MALTRIPKRCISANTVNEFRATYKGHQINIERERDSYRIGKEFYIIVTAPDGSYAYDGWWGDERNSMSDAVAEALKGACIA